MKILNNLILEIVTTPEATTVLILAMYYWIAAAAAAVALVLVGAGLGLLAWKLVYVSILEIHTFNFKY